MKNLKTITISLPAEMGKEIQELAAAEYRTVSELIREAFRQYKAQRFLNQLAQKGRSVARNKGLTQDGGPFEE